MTLDFYYLPVSAPCRSILMTAKALGVDLNLIQLSLRDGEHLKPAFIKLNPQHTIPTLVDNGFALWESRAILGYLVDQYAKNDDLFPKEAKKRAVVSQRLYFDMGLYQRFAEYFYPQWRENAPADPEKLQALKGALDFLNTFLEGQTYVFGDKLTIADLAIFSTISTFPVLINIDFPTNVQRWFELISKTAPGVELNQQGLDECKEYFAKK